MSAPISENDIIALLNDWGNQFVHIAQLHSDNQDYFDAANQFVDTLYNYQESPVLFKPTVATAPVFRTTRKGALSYFIGNDNDFLEDTGFALKHWKSANFDLIGHIVEEKLAIAMGNLKLTNLQHEEMIAHYTMGLKRNKSNQLKIVLHHSSLPYKP